MTTDFLKAAGGILATIAPTVASALGGPLAGMATSAVIGALGLAPETNQQDLMRAIAGATPDQLLKIKEVEQQFILDMKRLDVDIMKIQAGDTASARLRETQTQDWTPRLLAGLVLGLYVAIQYFIWGGHIIDPTMRDIVMRSLGTLDAAVGLVLGYYFGSSIGSRDKSAQITTIVENNKNGK